MIFRVASSIGTASPRPIPATAVLIPTTVPRPSASAPPELPGLSAASVWMTFSTSLVARPELRGRARPSALTTPAVTEPEKPSGFPIATTSCPTRSQDASPRSAGWRSRPSSRRTARTGGGRTDEPEDRPVPVVREGRGGGRGLLHVRLRRCDDREEDLLPGGLARPGRRGDDDRLHDRRAAVRRPERRSRAGVHLHIGDLVRRELRHAGGDRPALGPAFRGRSAT